MIAFFQVVAKKPLAASFKFTFYHLNNLSGKESDPFFKSANKLLEMDSHWPCLDYVSTQTDDYCREMLTLTGQASVPFSPLPRGRLNSAQAVWTEVGNAWFPKW